MRRAITIAPLLLACVIQAQQDVYRAKLSVQGGPVRSLGDITSGLETFDPERTAMLGISYEHFLSYGVSLYGGYEHLRLSGNDRETGNIARSLNFLAEVNTAQLGFRLYADNGRLLNYDARFAPFVQLGFGVGMYDVYGDLYDRTGNRYNYWSDGTIRTLPEGAPDAASAQLMDQDGVFETRLTNLATEEGKPRDPWFAFVPARVGMKWRISERFSAELAYAFNWTFTDRLDDVSGDYPATFASEELAYISNPAGHTGTRGGNDKYDHFHHLSLGLSMGIGRRAHRYRMPPIRTLAPPAALPTAKVDSIAAPKREAVKADTVEKRVVIEVESIRVGRLEVDTIIMRGSGTGDTEKRREQTIENVRKGEADNPIQKQGIRSDTLTATERSIDRVRKDEADNPVQKQGIRSDTLTGPGKSIENERMDGTDGPVHDKRVAPTLVPVVESPDTLKQRATPRDETSVPRSVPEPAQRGVAPGTEATPGQTPKERTEPAPKDSRTTQPAPAGNVEQRTTERIIERTAPPVVVVQKEVVRDTVVKEVPVLMRDTVRIKADTTVVVPKASSGTTTARSTMPPSERSEPTPAANSALEMQRDHAMQMNRLLNKRIGMLESFLAAQDEQGGEAKVDDLRQRIAQLDDELEALRKSAKTPVTDTAVAISMVTMDTVRFMSNSFNVRQSYQESLQATAERIIAMDAARVLVTGHTDRSGDAAFNLELSQRRAEAVAEVLRVAGVPAERIKVKGLGQELARAKYDRNERVVVVHVAPQEQ